jgi:hypothetical protein
MFHEQHAGQNYVVWGTGRNPVAHLLAFLWVWTFRLQLRLNIISTVLAEKFNFSHFLRISRCVC